MITTEQVKELRDATGVSVMQCKKALEEAAGDMEKALMILKQKSSDVAAKKADREANDGIVVVAKDDTKAILLELNCETDFVAKNEDFTSLAEKIANIALTEGEEAAKEKAPEFINEVVQKIGENIQLGSIETITGSTLGAYVHGGKTAVIVSLSGGTTDLARDIAMHIAAMRPEYIRESDIPEEDKARALELFNKEVEGSDKPADIKQKMLEGKLKTFFAERTLLSQPFVKAADQKIEDLLSAHQAELLSYTIRRIGA